MSVAEPSAKRLSTPILEPSSAATMLQSSFRGFRVRSTGLSSQSRAHSQSSYEAASSRRAEEIITLKRTPEYRQIRRCCKDADLEKLAKIDLELTSVVGLEAVKEYCAALRGDLIARAALGDAPLVRNVLVSGSLGTGKKLAAHMISSMAKALGAAKGCTITETTLDQLVLDVRRDVSCVIIEGLNGAESVKAKVNQVLHNFPRHLFIFIGPTKDVEALHGGLAYFRKAEPAWLQLPNYPAAQLADITKQQLQASGYYLQAGVGTRELQQALCTTWSRDVLSMRNAHLSTELVQRAISTRNRWATRPKP